MFLTRWLNTFQRDHPTKVSSLHPESIHKLLLLASPAKTKRIILILCHGLQFKATLNLTGSFKIMFTTYWLVTGKNGSPAIGTVLPAGLVGDYRTFVRTWQPFPRTHLSDPGLNSSSFFSFSPLLSTSPSVSLASLLVCCDYVMSVFSSFSNALSLYTSFPKLSVLTPRLCLSRTAKCSLVSVQKHSHT